MESTMEASGSTRPHAVGEFDRLPRPLRDTLGGAALIFSPLWNLPNFCTRQSLAEKSPAASGSGNVLTSRSVDTTDWVKGSLRLLRSGGSALPMSRPNWLHAPAFSVWLIY